MTFDEALRKFKNGDKYLDFCLTILKPQILRLIKESDDYHLIHFNCIDDTKNRFPKSEDGVYDSFDDLLLLDKYVAISLYSFLIFKTQIFNPHKDIEDYGDNSIDVEFDNTDYEYIFYNVYKYISDKAVPMKYIDMYNETLKDKIINYKEWEKLNIQN